MEMQGERERLWGKYVRKWAGWWVEIVCVKILSVP